MSRPTERTRIQHIGALLEAYETPGSDLTLCRASPLVHYMQPWQLFSVDHLISPAEFSTWYTPALTLGLNADLNFERVARDMSHALVRGDVIAAAAVLTTKEAKAERCKVPCDMWMKWPSYLEPRFWVTGDLAFPVPPNPDILLYGTRFDPVGVARLFPEMATRSPDAAPSSPPAKGGRPSGKNGEPIARVAKMLLTLTPDKLAACTNAAVAADLIAEYRRLNLHPPNEENAERDARGILRAVRN